MSKKKLPVVDIDKLVSQKPRGIVGSVQARASYAAIRSLEVPSAAPSRATMASTDRSGMRALIDKAGDDIQVVLDRLEDR